MKIGRDIVELAKEIERRRESARDFVADTRKTWRITTGRRSWR
jgi:hypothetical protein